MYFCQSKPHQKPIFYRVDCSVTLTINRRFNSLLTQAGVPHCGLHSLRHTFASYFYEYTNGNRKVVADYLGHSISDLTERVYVTTSDRFMEQSIRGFVL